MPQLNAQQLEQRKTILASMIKGKQERRPWLTRKEAAEAVTQELDQDPALLRMVNALAASVTIIDIREDV